ncbi:MAG: spore coat protein CotJB [Faecalibacillus faecis]
MDDTLLQISKLDFCIQDVTLFLDTHPNDQEAKNIIKKG